MSKYDFKSPQGIALHFSKRFQDNYPKEPLFEMMNDLSIAIHGYSQSQLSEYKEKLKAEIEKEEYQIPNDGTYYHYSQVCTLLRRFNASIEKELSELRKENEELHQSEILWFERNAELESQLSKAKELLIRVHEALTSQGMMSWVSKDYKEIESFLKS